MIKQLKLVLLLALVPGVVTAQSTVVEYYHVDAVGRCGR